MGENMAQREVVLWPVSSCLKITSAGDLLTNPEDKARPEQRQIIDHPISAVASAMASVGPLP
jgi:hypothetical protein